MERKEFKGQVYIKGYHTQEHRKGLPFLKSPMACRSDKAWLGIGYYFWTELEFARYWGEDSKQKIAGAYDIYEAYLNCENCINAVFDEEGYFFFRKQIESCITRFKLAGIQVSLAQVNRFLADEVWPLLGVDGVIYDDKPTNPYRSDRVYSEIPDLYYKKRIQLVLFDVQNIRNFDIILTNQKKTHA
jgi:hypothetical protein